MEKMKKNSKKGFTLVEIIVVLVIIAILAAIAIPSLTGYIDDAKSKQVITQAREVLTAAQTIASDNYSTSVVDPAKITGADINKLVGSTLLTDSDNGGNADAADATKVFTVKLSASGQITSLTYVDASGKIATYDGTTFKVG